LIRAVISDFGGVLTSPLFEAFAKFQADHGIALESLGQAMVKATEERGGENPLYALERGELRESEFLGLVGAALKEITGRDVDMRGFAEQYFGTLTPNEEMIGYLRSLKADRGIQLAMLTNNVREWEAKWRSFIPEIDELFPVIVDSAFVGMRKPERAIYLLTVERLGLEPADCAFVDDLEVNCHAAAEVGLHAVRFESTDQAIRDLEALLG
jgi:putative hydrolase of the HAD superfamily